MTYKITHLPTGDILHAHSELEAFACVDTLLSLHDVSTFLPFWWDLLHDFPADTMCIYEVISVESFSDPLDFDDRLPVGD